MSSQAIPSTNHDEWHRVHAQLLKSVADAQAKLLAAQNETNDRLERLNSRLEGLGVLGPRMILQHGDLQAGILSLSGKLNALEALLAKPRRQVEKLRPKRIVKRAVERKRHA